VEKIELLINSNILSKDDKEKLCQLNERIQKELEFAASSPLKIGLSGGTGVGKSTIINYLAESEISLASHKRPNTNNIIAYHHEDFEPEFENSYDRLVLIPHNNDNIKHIILFDLPDYDSILQSHKAMVIDFSMELQFI